MIALWLFATLSMAQGVEGDVFGPELPPQAATTSDRTDEQVLYDRLLAPPSELPTPQAVSAKAPTHAGWEGVAMGLGIAVLGAAAVLLWRRREGVGETPAPALQILARCQLDASSGLAVVSFDGHRMVIGTGATPPALIADYGPSALDELVRTPLAVASPPPSQVPPADFEHRLDAAQTLVEQMLRRREAS